MGFDPITAIAIVGLGLTAKGHIDQRKQAKVQRRELQKQTRIQQSQAAIQRRQQVRRMMAERRMAAAAQEVGASGAGALDSSGFAGARSSVTSQFGTNLGEFNAQVLLNRAFNESVGRVGASQTRSATAQSLGQLGSGIFSAAGGFGTLFGKNTPQPKPAK